MQLKNFYLRVVATIVSLLAAHKQILAVFDWQAMRGWEAYWVADALASGHGFSFPATNRWLFEDAADGTFHATAWVDPVYTFILAASIYLFGEYYLLAGAILNLLLFLGTFWLLYKLTARLLSEPYALIAVILLSISGMASLNSQLNNTFLATFLVLACALAALHYFERTDAKSLALLSVTLGLTILASPSTQLFLPVIVFTLVFWHFKEWRTKWKDAALISAITLAVISPWTIRNYITFDEFVPVRNGLGQIVYVGTIGADSLQKNDAQIGSHRQAVMHILYNWETREALEEAQLANARLTLGNQLEFMNEAQRDKWYMAQVIEFIKDEPVTTIKLAAANLEVLIRRMGLPGIAMVGLAILGALLWWRNVFSSTIALWAGSFAAPYAIIICYFPRYRLPIEPLLVFLSVLALAAVYRWTEQQGYWSRLRV